VQSKKQRKQANSGPETPPAPALIETTQPKPEDEQPVVSEQPKDDLKSPASDERIRDTRWWWLRVFDATPHSYFLVRIIFMRMLGIVYLFAFLNAWNQALPLLGTNGLLPACTYVKAAKQTYGSAGWQYFPTLLWLHCDDFTLQAIIATGLMLSALLVIGHFHILIVATLWLLYHSIVNVGQLFYGYGWEMQLLETGFLAIFLCPLLTTTIDPLCLSSPPSKIVVWLMRWLAFRIYLGAGLIKIRAGGCWLDFTCLD